MAVCVDVREIVIDYPGCSWGCLHFLACRWPGRRGWWGCRGSRRHPFLICIRCACHSRRCRHIMFAWRGRCCPTRWGRGSRRLKQLHELLVHSQGFVRLDGLAGPQNVVSKYQNRMGRWMFMVIIYIYIYIL